MSQEERSQTFNVKQPILYYTGIHKICVGGAQLEMYCTKHVYVYAKTDYYLVWPWAVWVSEYLIYKYNKNEVCFCHGKKKSIDK